MWFVFVCMEGMEWDSSCVCVCVVAAVFLRSDSAGSEVGEGRRTADAQLCRHKDKESAEKSRRFWKEVWKRGVDEAGMSKSRLMGRVLVCACDTLHAALCGRVRAGAAAAAVRSFRQAVANTQTASVSKTEGKQTGRGERKSACVPNKSALYRKFRFITVGVKYPLGFADYRGSSCCVTTATHQHLQWTESKLFGKKHKTLKRWVGGYRE